MKKKAKKKQKPRGRKSGVSVKQMADLMKELLYILEYNPGPIIVTINSRRFM